MFLSLDEGMLQRGFQGRGLLGLVLCMVKQDEGVIRASNCVSFAV